MKISVVWPVVVLAAALVLGTACSGDEGASPSPSPSSTGTGTPTPTEVGPDADTAAAAIERMATLLGVAPDLLEVTAVEEVVWSDSCFEIVRPGVECDRRETPGLRITVRFFDEFTFYELRSDRDLTQLAWNAPLEAEGELGVIDEDLALVTIGGTGPPFDDAQTPGVIQLAILPGSEFLTALADLHPGQRVRVAQDGRPSSDVGALVWIASRSSDVLDPWLELFEAGDLAAIVSTMRPQTLPCTLELGEGGPPKCWNFPQVPQEEGSEVEAFEVYGCASSWLPADRLEAELGGLPRRLLRYAGFVAVPVYQPGGALRDPAAAALIDYVAVFAGSAAVGIADGAIIAVWRGCGAGTPPEGFVPPDQREFLLPPLSPIEVNAPPLGTGVATLDAVIGEVEAQDVVALRQRLELHTLACTTEIGAGGSPKCGQGMPAGTGVEVFEFLGCEPEWLTAATPNPEGAAIGAASGVAVAGTQSRVNCAAALDEPAASNTAKARIDVPVPHGALNG